MKIKWVTIFILVFMFGFFLHSEKKSETIKDIIELSLEELLDVEVTVAGKKVQSISDSPGIISVLTADDIKRLGVINLVDIFSYIPGFTVTDNYWTREIVTAREVFQALYNDKILLLIDGMPAYEAINTEYYLDLIPIEAVARLEIIRGPGSTLYGTNAFAGVVNIITKRGEDINGIEIKATAGPNALFEKTVTIGKKTKNVDLFFAGSIRNDDGFTLLIPFDEAGATNLRQSFRKEFSRAHFRLGWKAFALSFQFLENDFDHFGMLPVAWAQGPVKNHTYNFNLSFSKQLSEKFSTTNIVRMMRQTREHYAGFFGTHIAGADIRVDGKVAEPPTYTNWKSIIYQLESQWNYTFSDKFSLVGGASIEKRDPYNFATVYDDWGFNEEERIEAQTGTYSYPPEKNKIDYGFYLQGDWRVKRFGIVGGLRYTYMGVAEKSFLAPRMALIFNPVKGINLKALYGMAFRSPTIYETGIFGPDVLYGNQFDIKPEKVSTYELAINYVGKKIGVRANYYYMVIDDIIGRRPLTDQEKMQLDANAGVIYDNINNQKLSGFEIEFKAYPVKNLDFFVNSSFRSGKDRDTQINLNYISKTLFSGGINWKLPQLNAEISPNFYYVGKREGLALDGNSYTFDGYFLVNLRAGVTLSKKLEISFIGKNLTNKRYYYPEMARNKIGIQLPGNTPRSFFIQVAYLLGL